MDSLYHTQPKPSNLLKLTLDKMGNAIARAKQLKPHVTWLGSRSYAVSGSHGNTYTVHFAVARDAQGKQVLLGCCNCEAGQHEMFCYHLAAASAVNIAIAAIRQSAATQFPEKDTRPDVEHCHGYEISAPKHTPKAYGRTLEGFQI